MWIGTSTIGVMNDREVGELDEELCAVCHEVAFLGKTSWTDKYLISQ